MAKNGYIVVDLCPYDPEAKHMALEQKKTFILTMKTAGELLDLDVRAPYQEKLDSEGVYAQYQPK